MGHRPVPTHPVRLGKDDDDDEPGTWLERQECSDIVYMTLQHFVEKMQEQYEDWDSFNRDRYDVVGLITRPITNRERYEAFEDVDLPV